MIVRSLLIWLVILILANLNGIFRQTILLPRMNELAAYAISTVLLSVLVFVAAWLAMSWIGPVSIGEAWIIGVLWLLLTLGFEFLVGHYLFGNPWEKLLADYNVAQGRIWPLVLLTVLVAPVVTFLLRRE
jgi:hypothetical protein